MKTKNQRNSNDRNNLSSDKQEENVLSRSRGGRGDILCPPERISDARPDASGIASVGTSDGSRAGAGKASQDDQRSGSGAGDGKQVEVCSVCRQPILADSLLSKLGLSGWVHVVPPDDKDAVCYARAVPLVAEHVLNPTQPLTVKCPWCFVPAGTPCFDNSSTRGTGRWVGRMHYARVDAVRPPHLRDSAFYQLNSIPADKMEQLGEARWSEDERADAHKSLWPLGLPCDPNHARYAIGEGKAIELTLQRNAAVGVLKKMVADEAFTDLCQGIGEEPQWLKDARSILSKAAQGGR